MERIEALIKESRRWAGKTRVREVLEPAFLFLRDTLHIDAGFCLYNRAASGRRDSHSWGFETPIDVLTQAVEASVDRLPEIEETPHWILAETSPHAWRPILERERIVQTGAWILRVHDEMVGLVVLGRRRLDMGDSDIVSLCMVQISMVTEMMILRRDAEYVGLRDPLTGLLNRRGFMQAFDEKTASAEASDTLMLTVIDIDEFKQTNDDYGHLAGDDLLIRVARTLEEHLSVYDGLAARFGGDEFVLFAKVPTDDTDLVQRYVASWCQEIGVQVSVGSAVFGRDGHDFDHCFSTADHRLYQRKAITRSVGLT